MLPTSTPRACSAPMNQMLLVAVHPWDIHGAHQADMHTGWISKRHTRTTSLRLTCTLPASRTWPGRLSPAPPERTRGRPFQAALMPADASAAAFSPRFDARATARCALCPHGGLSVP